MPIIIPKSIFSSHAPKPIKLSGLRLRTVKMGGFDAAKPGKKSCPKTIRDQLRNIHWKGKHEGPCFCCGRKIYDSENTEAGRIKAGGKYSIQNTRLICKTCNRGMGKENLKIYMKRNYPERYKKYFPKSDNNGTKKPRTKKSPRQPTNPWGFPQFRI